MPGSTVVVVLMSGFYVPGLCRGRRKSSPRPRVVADQAALAQDRPRSHAREGPDADARGQQRAVGRGRLGQCGAVPDDGVADGGPRPDGHVAREHGIGADVRTRGHATAGADVERALERRPVLDARLRVHPAAVARDTLERYREAAAQDVAVDLEVLLGRPDVDPVPAVDP